MKTQTLWIVAGLAAVVVVYWYMTKQGTTGGASGTWVPNSTNRVVGAPLPGNATSGAPPSNLGAPVSA
jgi:hypothetical protein